MLDNMTAFVRVIDKNGFAKAARDLHLSTPVITRRINTLEKELGMKLIARSTRTLAITEAGKVFYERAKEILYALDSARLAVHSMKDSVCGNLKIGIPASLNNLYLIPALPAFLKKYPHLNIEIIQGNHLLELLDRGFDVIIHCGSLPDSNYHFRKLADWTKITCASPGYFKKHKIPKTPEDLSKHHCLDHADNHNHSWNYQINGECRPTLVRGNIRVNNSADLKTLALSHLGLVYLPSFVIQKELKNKQLIPVLDAFKPKPLGMYAVYPNQHLMSKKLQVFLDFLQMIMKP